MLACLMNLRFNAVPQELAGGDMSPIRKTAGQKAAATRKRSAAKRPAAAKKAASTRKPSALPPVPTETLPAHLDQQSARAHHAGNSPAARAQIFAACPSSVYKFLAILQELAWPFPRIDIRAESNSSKGWPRLRPQNGHTTSLLNGRFDGRMTARAIPSAVSLSTKTAQETVVR